MQNHPPSRADVPSNPPPPPLARPNPDGEAVKITKEGWQLPPNPKPSRRSRSQQPLPPPVTNHQPPATLPTAAAAWLLSALRPTGPYPILVLKGPAGSGKTILVRTLRTLIDPATSTFSPLPRTAHDLIRTA